ncbi:TRAP transporter substrate-binding protein [Roseomonas eburnea]|uniref:TRAP transporter substrate-binding protein n=1 Tax=Neoroseomonas eburnea TaxID=1346889 RepID=A0A9X9XIV4_9PROT|nr:TRAP transporter substrate-binding protein [Neoroseomonas eburnea]MBR0683640.1 TRAP transporter substrate-binding protein [Neoroseomonas eburnea]
MPILRRRGLLAASGGLAAAAIAPGGARAQTRWQVATAYPDGNFHTRNMRAFVDQVQATTGGRLQIQLHSNASLLRMPEIKRGVQTGQVQIGEILLSAYGNEDPFFEVDSVPMLVTSTAMARKLAELQKSYVEARLNRQGLSLLYWVPWPPSGLYTNAPVESVDTLRGTKMRTFNALTNRFATLCGATPTLVQQAEVPQAFATGVVNVMVTSAATGVDVQAWDFCRVFTPIGFTRTKNAIFVRQRDLAALPADVQAAIRSAAAAAETRGWDASDAETVSQQATLATRGMTVQQPTPALMQGLMRIGATQVDEWVAKAGDEGKRLIDAYRAAIA